MKRSLLVLALLLGTAASPEVALAQERANLTGQVVATDTQRPLWGVLVEIPALRMSAITDDRGRFLMLQIPHGTHMVRATVLGYRPTTLEVTVGVSTPSVTLSMGADPLLLEELVVTGYGTERRANVAGAVSSLRPEIAREIPAPSINQVLQGRLTGVQVNQNSGTPGGAITVRVRGSSSISGGNDPLYVIDGVPMTQGNFSRNGTVGFGGQSIDALGDINATEIESIEILKDASAAAIYGSRASNGVVIITTKRGVARRPEISFGAYYGTQDFWRRVQMLNAQQYMEIYNEGCAARYAASVGCVVNYTEDSWIPSAPGADTDWVREITQPAGMGNMDVSIRGGTDQIRYYVAGSLLNQDGVVSTQGYQRMNGRINLDYDPMDKLSLGTNVSLTRSVYDRTRSDNTIYGVWANSLANPPIQPVLDEAGGYYETLYANPVGIEENSESQDRGIRILGNTFAAYTLADGIVARATVGIDNLTLRSRSYDSPAYGPWSAEGGAADAASSFVNKLTYEGRVNFDRTFSDRHQISGVVGASYEDNVDEGFQVRGQNFPNELFKYITSAATIASGTSNRSDWTLMSYFGRFSYALDDRLTTTLNIRRDGSSRFGAQNQYGTFPSGSVLWRVSEEGFMEDFDLVTNLAFRASYGFTGNQQSLGNFASRGLFGGGANYFDQPGITPTQLANPNLRWEKTKQMNLGMDFSVLSSRLAFNLDYYKKDTDDLLVARPVPRTTGYTSIWDNVGSMRNQGLELATTARIFVPAQQGALSWTSTLNVSRNRNEVTALYNDQPIGTNFRVEVGKPLGFIRGYVTDGIFQSYAEIQAHARQVTHADPRRATAPGDIRFKDLNGDGVINAQDQEMIGSPWPDFEGGWTNTLGWQSFDITTFVQFSQGNDVYNGFRVYADQYGSWGDNHTVRAMKRWRPDATDTDEPRAIWGDPNQNTRTSSRFVEDGSYVRLKNVILGYTVPAETASRVGFKSARVYVQGQNLLTRTNYSGWDPEVNAGGTSSITRAWDFYTLPQLRVFTFGVNVGM